MKIFFFDDEKLFGCDNVRRVYGQPELIPDSIYSDGVISTDYGSLSVLVLSVLLVVDACIEMNENT